MRSQCSLWWSEFFDLIQNETLRDPSALKRSRHGAPEASAASAKPIISAFYLQTEMGAIHAKLAP